MRNIICVFGGDNLGASVSKLKVKVKVTLEQATKAQRGTEV